MCEASICVKIHQLIKPETWTCGITTNSWNKAQTNFKCRMESTSEQSDSH